MDAKVSNYAGWQSDIIVDLIKRYGFPYITLNPGASFRGLHDSLVNYGGNDPPLLLCHQRRLRLQLAAKLFQIVGFQSRPRRRARAGDEQGGGGEQAEAQGDSSSRGTRAASIDDLRGGPDKSKNAVRGRGLR